MIPGVRMDKGSLVIDNFTSQGYFLKVIRNERWLENSPVILEVNDEILAVVKSSTNDLVLQHFHIVAITENNNSVMIKRMAIPNNRFFISGMNNFRYREVLFEFINRLKDRAAL